MAQLIFEGWNVGMRKISFIKLLHEKGGLSLTESKRIKEKLFDDNPVTNLIIENDELATEIYEESKKLGVKVRINYGSDERH